ncbi:uncharacterized protein LOC143217805 [Lasioglossum baleicum]|uniref:uncharacterized protein LOC143217805 n=1 Tax=Lasioglossum baleicum TaxID=434251 RepID=UPI003FCE2739
MKQGMPVKMKEIRLNILLIAIVCSVPLILAVVDRFDENEAYCYQFRWVASGDTRPDKNNCTGKGVPCVEPLYAGSINMTDLWVTKNESSFCSLSNGDVCLKYTISLGNEIVNQSFFCGKVIEDDVAAITSGCYEDKKEGYNVGLCACRSRKGAEPCNASSSINYSIFMLLIIFFVHAYKY